MLRRTAPFLLAGLLGACTNNPPPAQPDAGTVKVIGRSCNTDDECGGLKCDLIRRQCICQSDDDCAEIHSEGDLPYCNNFTGLCVATVAGCKADNECPSSSYCDEQVRACKVRKGFCETCNSNRECGGDADDCLPDTALKGSYCGTFCVEDAECPAGSACTSFSGKKQCWPKAGKNCKIFMGCTPDSKQSCTTTADCATAADQVCDPGSGICVARIQICPFGQICDARSRVCVDACTSDADCLAIDPKLRCVNRACEPIGECAATKEDPTGDKTCPTNKVCSFNPGVTYGTCVPFCASDQECAPGAICIPTADSRRKCQIGCRVPADCPLDKTCVKSGSATGTCQGSPGATCQADVVCPDCASCDLKAFGCTTKSMKNDGFCRTCGSDSECGAGHCLTLKGGITRCGQPCPATGCPRGFVCTEICVNGSYTGSKCSGSTFAECIPADQSCSTSDGLDKCKP